MPGRRVLTAASDEQDLPEQSEDRPSSVAWRHDLATCSYARHCTGPMIPCAFRKAALRRRRKLYRAINETEMSWLDEELAGGEELAVSNEMNPFEREHVRNGDLREYARRGLAGRGLRYLLVTARREHCLRLRHQTNAALLSAVFGSLLRVLGATGMHGFGRRG